MSLVFIEFVGVQLDSVSVLGAVDSSTDDRRRSVNLVLDTMQTLENLIRNLNIRLQNRS